MKNQKGKPAAKQGIPVWVWGVAAVLVLVVIAVIALQPSAAPAATTPAAKSGAAAALVGTALFAGLIVLGFAWLPSKPVPLRAHVPGAITLALGIQLLGMVGEFFVAEELTNAEQLYGVLGLAATLLFVLYLIGRITVWSCELNAVAWEVWHGDGAPAGPVDRAAG